MIYAQIDVNGVCFAVSQLSGAVESPNLIELPFYDDSKIGQRWLGVFWEKYDAATSMWVPA